MTATYLTDEQITMTMIAKAGERMKMVAFVENLMDGIDIGRIAHAIMVDIDGEGYSRSLASELAQKRIVRGLLSLGAHDLESTVERMANGTPEEAAWTFGFYALV
jgi:glutamate formiminotransferase